MNPLALMQGRLLPPIGGRLQAFPGSDWPREFAMMSRIGLAQIELVVDDSHPSENPVLAPELHQQLIDELAKHGILAPSVCGDVLMQHSFVAHPDQSVVRLTSLTRKCQAVGASRLVIPLVDQVRLRGRHEYPAVWGILRDALEHVGSATFEYHLETDLSPAEFAHLLEGVADQRVKVNYDTGNSAALGYRCDDEFAAYGERVGSVHIKDRVRGGGSVALGQGDTDFPAAFRALRRIGYAGSLVLQAARGASGEEIGTVGGQVRFVRRCLDEAAA